MSRNLCGLVIIFRMFGYEWEGPGNIGIQTEMWHDAQSDSAHSGEKERANLQLVVASSDVPNLASPEHTHWIPDQIIFCTTMD